MIDSEKSVIIGYLIHLLESPGHKSNLIQGISEYIENDASLLGPRSEEISDLLEAYQDDLSSKHKLSRKTAEKLSKDITRVLSKGLEDLESAEPGLLETNLRALAQHLGLDPLEKDFLGLAVRHRAYGHFSSCINDVCREHQNTIELCARCLGAGVDELNERLRPEARLLSSGILAQSAGTGHDLDDSFQVLEQALSALQKAQGGLVPLLEAILGTPVSPCLDWSDFDHMGSERERLCRFLSRAVQEKVPGVNILLWGPPGTGKTEFCKSLAAQLDFKLYAVGEKDDEGDEPSRKERMSSFRLAQNLLRYQSDTLLLFDEMDDLFEGQALARLFGAKLSMGSKVFLNRVLETNPIPTLWIINDVSTLDEAFVRRMNLALEFNVPPASSREKIWERVMKKNAVDLPSEEMSRLIDLNIPPSVVDSAARFTRRIGGTPEDFRFAAMGIIQAMRNGAPLPRPEATAPFIPELCCADFDLSKLTGQLCGATTKAFSLCLYGPPGTGKSAYLRHLAEAMPMPVLLKRASDLLDMYVGGSEKQIAAAFEEAIDREAMLIFDEADSLLADRRNAVRSWEVSQVNEMLTWMERHPLPFACTTNLMAHLDQASMRRFTFKLGFRFMTQEQTEQAFEIFFKQTAPPSLRQLQHLTPGDFTVALKKAQVLGVIDRPEEIVQFLVLEEGEKRLRQRIIGF